MAAEALIVEDAYQKGYADAMADMRKKKEQRRQREQAKKARRWYFIKQKACGLAMLAITVLAVWATEGDITIAFITVPLGLTCIFSKEMLIMNDYYFTTKERKKNHDTDFRIAQWYWLYEKAKKAISAHNKKIANIEAFIRCAEEEQEKQKGKKDNETTGS